MTTPASPDERQQPPQIAACFLVVFDQTVGYNLTWGRSSASCPLDHAGVEYKALPSGLHKVQQDLIYFLHDGHAGLAFFQSGEATEADRNATFRSVGVMVPLHGSRLGQIWLHAEGLEAVAKKLSQDCEDTDALEKYWQTHQQSATAEPFLVPIEERNDQVSPNDREADANPPCAGQDDGLSRFHPVLRTTEFIDTFGPLIFPLYKASLLRKRILLVKPPPMHECCDFVFVLSLLGSIPAALLERLPSGCAVRSKALFCVGINDIASLGASPDISDDSERHKPLEGGWIACTSDELLSTKSRLYDLKVESREVLAKTSKQSTWPKLTYTDTGTLRATQRDLRRYRAMRQGLVEFIEDFAGYRDAEQDDDEDESASLLARSKMTSCADVADEDEAVESASWAAIAYDSFMWWASAGERNSQLEDEYAQDKELPLDATSWLRGTSIESSQELNSIFKLRGGALEMAVVAYFHRLTTSIISTLAHLVSQCEADDATGLNDPVRVSRDDMEQMGLDTWSKADREFVAEILRVYWDRDSEIQGSSIECCGVRFY